MSDNGGPAFPYGVRQTIRYPYEDERVVERNEEGMTLRDYFAAKALQSFIVAAGASNDIQGLNAAMKKAGAKDGTEWTAIVSYQMADAMLKARQS